MYVWNRKKGKEKDKSKRLHRWKQRLPLFLVLLLLAALATAPIKARADFGGFSGDSDYGGGGGGGSSSWSSSDYDSDDGSMFDFSTPTSTALSIGGILFWAVIIIWAFRSKGDNSSHSSRPQGAMETPNSSLRSMQEYKKLDPGFNEPAFREHLSNLYVQMKNIESLKPYFTDAFYYQSDRQLDELRKAGRTPCTERVAVLEATPRGFYQDAGMDHIVVRMRARIVAYILDDKSGNVVSGDRSREKFMVYEWDLCRKSGVMTEQAKGTKSINCPHCGAPLAINQTAQCEYCGSVVNIVNEDWALNNIKGISQQTK